MRASEPHDNPQSVGGEASGWKTSTGNTWLSAELAGVRCSTDRPAPESAPPVSPSSAAATTTTMMTMRLPPPRHPPRPRRTPRPMTTACLRVQAATSRARSSAPTFRPMAPTKSASRIPSLISRSSRKVSTSAPCSNARDSGLSASSPLVAATTSPRRRSTTWKTSLPKTPTALS